MALVAIVFVMGHASALMTSIDSSQQWTVDIDQGRVVQTSNGTYEAEIYTIVRGEGSATLVWYVNDREVLRHEIQAPYSAKETVPIGARTRATVWAKVVDSSGNVLSCTYPISYEYNQDYPYNDHWKTEVIHEHIPCEEKDSTPQEKQEITANITVNSCERTLADADGCVEYSVKVSPDDAEYRLVVKNQVGDVIKEFSGKGSGKFRLEWGIEQGSEGVPSCAEVVVSGEKITEKCGGIPIPTPKESKEDETVHVIVKSPYPYEYEVQDNEVILTIHINYVARNSCYGVRAEVENGECKGCYVVKLVEKTPTKDAMCAQIIRTIPTVTAHIPILEGIREIKIEVQELSADKSERKKLSKSLDCLALEVKMAKIREALANCMRTGNCEEVRETLRKLAKEYEKKCGPVEPIRPIAPPEPPAPPRIIIPKLPVELDINNDTVILKGKNITVRVRTKVSVTEKGLVSNISGKEITPDVDEIVEKVQNSAHVEVRDAELIDTGTGPKYVVKAVKKGRILGIFPTTVDVQVVVDATSGNVVKTEMPWWSFLLWG